MHHCLRGHPAISALHDELALEPFFTDGLATFTTGSSGTETERKEGRRSLFNALTEPGRTSNTQACGAKCAFGYGSQGARFADVVQREFPQAKIIHVVRQDQVALFGSRVRAQDTGIYYQKKQRDAAEGPTFSLDRYRFVSHMLDMNEVNVNLRRLRETHDVFTVEYEADILSGELRTDESLFSFVDVEPQTAMWLDQRKISPPPEAYILNYDELRKLQSQVEEQLAEGQSPSKLRKKYSPPP